MQRSTEAEHARRKREAVRGVALFGLLQLACTACLASLCFIPDLPGWTVVLFAVLAAIPLLMMAGAFVVLKQRFREIEGGEQDAAGQY